MALLGEWLNRKTIPRTHTLSLLNQLMCKNTSKSYVISHVNHTKRGVLFRRRHLLCIQRKSNSNSNSSVNRFYISLQDKHDENYVISTRSLVAVIRLISFHSPPAPHTPVKTGINCFQLQWESLFNMNHVFRSLSVCVKQCLPFSSLPPSHDQFDCDTFFMNAKTICLCLCTVFSFSQTKQGPRFIFHISQCRSPINTHSNLKSEDFPNEWENECHPWNVVVLHQQQTLYTKDKNRRFVRLSYCIWCLHSYFSFPI